MVLVLGLKSTRALLEHLCLHDKSGKFFCGVTEKLHLNGACEFSIFFFLLYCFSKSKKLRAHCYFVIYCCLWHFWKLNHAKYCRIHSAIDHCRHKHWWAATIDSQQEGDPQLQQAFLCSLVSMLSLDLQFFPLRIHVGFAHSGSCSGPNLRLFDSVV